MRIEEFSTDLTFFARFIRMKFKLKYYCYNPASPSKDPAMFFGCAGMKQREVIKSHRGFAVIVWGGSDSMFLNNKNKDLIPYFKENKHRIFHIAHSHWIQDDLKEAGIEYIDRVVLPVDFDPAQFRVAPVGKKVYHYMPSSKSRYGFYGTDVVKEIEKRVGNNHVLAGKFLYATAEHVPRNKIHEYYAQSFVGVRLTDHDNMSLSCIEMGLMGRRSIFNGNIPGAIPYEKKEPGHVMDLIMEEYQYSEPDKTLSEEMWEFVQDDGSWLETKFYEQYGYSSTDSGIR